MINQRLFDQYKINTKKDLKIKHRCARPFDTVLIDKKGSCYACECTAWLPQSIGSLQVKDLQDIIGSDMHQTLQDSISDGTYRFCNQSQCSYIRSGLFYQSTEQKIKHIRLAIDDSCNLRCPSCRNGLIFHKDGSKYQLGLRLADKVNQWLLSHTDPLMVHIGADGDPFASHVYRHFMENTPRRDNITYSILTNGLMLRDLHSKVPHVIAGLETLGISIDGASEQTYEKLRLGGKWDKALDALYCGQSLKEKHGFKLHLHMVVQQDNWHEMEQMVELGRKYNADTVYFNSIEDWNTNMDMSTQKFKKSAEFVDLASRLKNDSITWMNL